MANTGIKSTSKSIAAIVPLINANPGISGDDLQKLSGYSRTHLANVLSALSKAGHASAVPTNGLQWAWFPADIAAGMLAERAAAKAEKQAATSAYKLRVTDRSKIISMSAEEGGASSARLMAEYGIRLSSIGKHFKALEARVMIFRASRPGCRLRWFDTAQRAADWAALPMAEESDWSAPRAKAWAHTPRKEKPPKVAVLRVKEQNAVALVAIGERIKSNARQPSKAPPALKGSQRNRVVPTKPSEPAPVNLKSKATDMRGKVDYSRAKVTLCPSTGYDARYQLAPDTRVLGGFSTAGIGRYLE